MRPDLFDAARAAILQGDIPQALEMLLAYLNSEKFRHSLERDKLFKINERYWRYQEQGRLAQDGKEDGQEEKRIQGELLMLIQQLESGAVESIPMPKAPPPGIFGALKAIVTAPLALIPIVQSAFASADVGKIVYESPSRMRLNHAEYVAVRISHKALKEEVLKEGLDAAKTKEGELEISDVMEVALFEAGGQQNFDISPLNNAEQILNKKSYTEWRFFLNAKRVGKFSLILRVSMKVNHPELGEKKKDIVTWSTSIEVGVDSEVQMENVRIKRIEWSKDLKKSLKERIANNEFSSVFQDLANHLSSWDTELFNDLVLLQTRFNSLGNANRSGILSHEEYTVDFNRIAGGLIMLIDEAGSPRGNDSLGMYKSEIKKMKEVS